ncbi:caspase domain-containing protein [Rhizoctonia solani]|nr:caspase domain-containing protein [Rhizoctonia solani]
MTFLLLSTMSHPSSNGSLSSSSPTFPSGVGGIDSPLDKQFLHGSTRTGSQTLIPGKKKALCIGINYRAIQYQELEGCVNDANNMAGFLIHHLGFSEQNIIKLTDDTPDHGRLPTRANIISAMNWLVKDAKPGDSLFFHFSGHGGQAEDLEGDEIDGYDEDESPLLTFENQMMHDLIVRPLPPGCRLTALFDCSHSGSALDLPYAYTSRGKVKKPSRLADVGKGLLGMRNK